MPYTLRAAARALHVSPETARKWLNDKRLYEVPVNGGARLVSDESVQRVARELGVNLNEQTTS